MTDTIQKIADEIEQSSVFEYLARAEEWTTRLRALSARASAGEGEPIGYVDPQRIHELKEGRLNIALFAERMGGNSLPLYAAAPQPAQAGASGGGGRWLAEQDAKHLGTGYLVDGERVAPDRIEIIAAAPQPQQAPAQEGNYPEEFDRDGSETTDAADLIATTPYVARIESDSPNIAVSRFVDGIMRGRASATITAQDLFNTLSTYFIGHPALATPPAHGDGEAYPTSSDREVLLYLMQQFDAESWECPRCGHSEDCKTMDSATYLRNYLATRPAPEAQEAREYRLFDSQWVNVVNHAGCYRDMNKDDAVAQAVKLTEQAMAANINDCKWPRPRKADAALALPAQGRVDG